MLGVQCFCAPGENPVAGRRGGKRLLPGRVRAANAVLLDLLRVHEVRVAALDLGQELCRNRASKAAADEDYKCVS